MTQPTRNTPPPAHTLTEEQVSLVKAQLDQGKQDIEAIAQTTGLPEDQVRIVIAQHNRAFRKR
jgi:hypothetical protein